MARPSVLSDREWAEIGRRLASGESQSKLAKEFKISRASIIGRFSDRVSDIRDAGRALADAELMVERLPVIDRVSARTLADQLKGIQNDFAEAAAHGARAGRIVGAKMLKQAEELPDNPSPEDLKPIMAGSETVKSLLGPATSLISQSKLKAEDADRPLHTPEQLRKMAELQERHR